MERLKGILPMTRKGALVLLFLLVLYVVLFHFVYHVFGRGQSRQISMQNSWTVGLMTFWNKETSRSNDDEKSLHVDSEHSASNEAEVTSIETAGNARHRTGSNSEVRLITVAIGGGITSKRLSGVNETNIASKFQLLFTFIPSFCLTASPGFDYHFYFSYDYVDHMLKKINFLKAFQRTFLNVTRSLCPKTVRVDIHMVQCNHAGKPTWAQNDAMIEAYLDNVEYYYRINDDTKMITKNWTEMFIDVLRNYNPSNVGVVGPNHSGGNRNILTYDFVHRTHVDIFGFYYPRLFTDWWGDTWMTNVYKPHRSTKLVNVRLAHTLGLGQRYGVNGGVRKNLQGQLDKDRLILKRYINYTQSKMAIKDDGRKVISMSLFGRDPKYLWGAIRNAQVAPIFFPGWKLRIYVPNNKEQTTSINNSSLLVPKRILNKLKQLGAEIAYVKTKSIPPVLWRYLVIDDTTVDYFIIRNVHSRLSERDAIVVNDWLDHQHLKSDVNSLHCIRDHPNHANRSIVDGLWGGNRPMVRRRLGQDMSRLLYRVHGRKSTPSSKSYKVRLYNVARSFRRRSFDDVNVLEDFVWSVMAAKSYCHDSVACDAWLNARKFPVRREVDEYLGQLFDEHHEPISISNKRSPSNFDLKCTKTP